MRSPRSFYLGVFTVCAATLMLQVIHTRLLSVVTWYHLAFFVVSIAMFGMTAGAVFVYLRRERFDVADLGSHLSRYTTLFAIASVLSIAWLLTLSPLTSASALAVMMWLEMSVLLAAPFFFSGVVVSLALTRCPLPIGRIYGADLTGASAGCLAVLGLLNVTDAISGMLWTSVLIGVAACLFSFCSSRLSAKPFMGFFVLLAIAAGNEWVPSEYSLRPIFIKGRVEAGANAPRFREWNSFSRVAVHSKGVTMPSLNGPGKDFPPNRWRIEQDHFSIDGGASTVGYHIGGDLSRAEFLRYDITGLAYNAPGIERAAVIGMGGGRDVLTARVYGVPEVTGIEINPILVRLVTEEPGFADKYGLMDVGGVEVCLGEARSWFASTERTFDSIQMSLIDTWAATGAGAYSLSENGLYTIDAWKIFCERLEPNGIFTVTRWYAPGEVVETGRMISLAAATVLELGSENPQDHVFLAGIGPLATLVLGRDPLTRSQLDGLQAACEQHGYKVIASPDSEPTEEFMRDLLSATSLEQLVERTEGYLLELSPPTDEKPFFFNQLPLGNPIKTLEIWRNLKSRGVTSGNLTATATLVLLLLISLVFVLVTIVLPLRHAVRDTGGVLACAGTGYFFLIGVGFMCTEISLLQRMSVFLGHPVYSLSIVLFALILTTGIGSLASDRYPLDRPLRFHLWSLLTGGYLIAFPLWAPELLLEFDRMTLMIRILICIACIAPAGFLMGFGFPTGMKLVAAIDERPTPWFWGVNGAAGVLASSLAVATSIAYGISTTLICGGACYLLLNLFVWGLGLGRTPAQTAIRE